MNCTVSLSKRMNTKANMQSYHYSDDPSAERNSIARYRAIIMPSDNPFPTSIPIEKEYNELVSFIYQ